MKKVFLLLMVSGLFSMTYVSAQEDALSKKKLENSDNYRGERRCLIPGLTNEQQESINELKTVHLKKVSQLRADLQEKNARLQSLRVADTYNEKEINKTIDDIAAVRANIMKESENHRQKVRSLLSDDQKAWFDSRPMKNRSGDGSCYYGDGNRFGRRDGMRRGDCYGRGFGRGNRF